MKNLKYIALSLFAVTLLFGCKDDPKLLTTDIGPVMTNITAYDSAVFGGQVAFSATMNDQYPLSTLKAQIFFDDEMVAEEVIRTKTNGTYEGTVTVPYYKDIADGVATLRLVGQNIRFGLTEVERPLAVSRPMPNHLIYMLNGVEYRMEPTGTPYEYSVTAQFPQKPKGYILTPELDNLGSVVTFGFDAEVGGVAAGSTEPIPFANASAGEYTITFNIKTFEGSPFIKLMFDGVEMTMLDGDNYFTTATLTQGSLYELTGVPNFEEWNIDMDFFERGNIATPEQLTLLPMTGLYKVTANFKYNYLKVEAMKSATDFATLSADGTGGAIWAIGDMSFGKPTTKNGASWSPENGGLCLARVADKKFQITLVGGVSINATKFDFKLFWQKTWGGEFKGPNEVPGSSYGRLSTTSDIIKVGDTSGNLGLADGKTLDLGGIYRFTVDVSGGVDNAVLTVEKIGDQPLPPADLTANGVKLTQVDADNYYADLDLTKGQAIAFGGADIFTPLWYDNNFLSSVTSTSATVNVVSGRYRLMMDVGSKFVRMKPVDASGNDAVTADDGTGALYMMGYGAGVPSLDYQFGWNPPTTTYSMAEVEPAVYVITGTAGPEQDSALGDYFRYDYIGIKYFMQNGWGGEMGDVPVTGGLLKNTGDLGLNGVELELGSTYELKVDLTAGKDNGKVSFIKK